MSIVLNRPFYQVCHQHQGGNDSFAQIHIVHFIFPESFTFKGKSSQHQHRPFSFLSKFQISQEIWHCRASKTAPGSCQPLNIFLIHQYFFWLVFHQCSHFLDQQNIVAGLLPLLVGYCVWFVAFDHGFIFLKSTNIPTLYFVSYPHEIGIRIKPEFFLFFWTFVVIAKKHENLHFTLEKNNKNKSAHLSNLKCFAYLNV